MLALGIIVPISIGLLIKAKRPKVANVLSKLLKPLALFFILFVMIFGVIAYWDIFKFFTWRVSGKRYRERIFFIYIYLTFNIVAHRMCCLEYFVSHEKSFLNK